MHHALRVQEIVGLIFEAVLTDTRIGKPTLAALATTCRALQEPALDVLWSAQESLVPLLKCMPTDLWQVWHLNRRMRKVVFVRSVLPTDWERFDYYAPRIKSLGFITTVFNFFKGVTQIDWDVIPALWTAFREQPLLPRLRKLRIRPADDDREFIYIHLFLGGPLQSLVLDLSSCDSDLGDLFLALKELPSSQFLRTLTVHSKREVLAPCEFSLPFRELICALPHLRQLHCGRLPLDTTGILHCVSLPILQTLQLPNDPNDIVALHLPPKPFPSLQHLTLTAPDQLTSCSGLVKAVLPHQLKSLRINLDTVADPTTTELCLDSHFHVLHNCCSHTRISSLEFIQSGLDASYAVLESIEWKFSRATITPLLVFSNLIKLDINILCPVDLDNITLRDMAVAWPKLQCLRLGHKLGWGKTSRITLRGLLPLVASCPELDTLQIVIDASRVEQEDWNTRQLFNTKITSLGLGDSMIGDEIAVAAFLANIFPNLIALFVGQHYFRGDRNEVRQRNAKGWEVVGKLLKEIASGKRNSQKI